MILVVDESCVEKIAANADETAGFDYLGLVLTNRNAEGEVIAGLKVVSSIENAAEYIYREWVDEVFIYSNLTLESELSPNDEEVDYKKLFFHKEQFFGKSIWKKK